MRHCSFTLLALAITSCCVLSGAEADSATIIVTADRSESDDWRTTASTSTVTAEDIHLIGTPDAWTAPLRTLPGVDLINSAGGLDGGGLPTLRLRGTASNADTAVLVDGIPWSDATAIGTDPQLLGLDLAGVEQLEVVRGPQSGLYGSRGLGGAVNVRTVQPTQTHTGRVRAGFGSFNTRSIAAQASGPLVRQDDRMLLGFAIAANALESDGISALVSGADADPDSGETDRLWRTGLNARTVYAPSEQVRISAGGWIGSSHHDYDTTGPDDDQSQSQTRIWRATAGAEIDLANDGLLVVDAARTRTHRDDVSPYATGAFTGTVDYVSARLLLPLSDLVSMQIGSDLDHQHATYTAITEGSQNALGVWGQALLSSATWEATAIVRYDDFSAGEDPLSWKIGGAWFPEERWRLHGTVGTAYRAPSLDERYSTYFYPGFPPFFPDYTFNGNPDLDPQKSLGWDAGASYGWQEVILDLTAFGTHYENRIVRIEDESDPTATFATLDNEASSSRTVGAEAGVTWRSDDPWWSRLAVTYQDSAGEDGQAFFLLPDWKGAWLIGWQAEQWWTTATAQVIGSRRASQANEELDAYATLDLAAGYAPRPWLEIVARIDNVTDERYVTQNFFSPDIYYSGVPRAFSLAIEGRY